MLLDGGAHTSLLQRWKTHPSPRVKNSCSRLWNNEQEVRGGGRTAFAFAEDVGVLVSRTIFDAGDLALEHPAASLVRLVGEGRALGTGVAFFEALALSVGGHIRELCGDHLLVTEEVSALGNCILEVLKNGTFMHA